MMMTTKKIQEEEEEKKPNPRPEGSTSPPDRISELPVEILHHILGFLEMDEFLIQTSLVSTKWRNLWKSVPNLKFPTCTTSRRRRSRINDDDDDVSAVVHNGDGGGITNNVEKYHNFMDHVLRLHDSQASKIQYFSYSCDDDYNNSREGGGEGGGGGYDKFERLHKLIVSAVVNQGAQEIQILGRYLIQSGGGGGGGDDDDGNKSNIIIIHFHPSIFTSKLLRKFIFAVFIMSDYLIQFPRSMCCATHLTHLTLIGIRLPEGDDNDDDDDDSNGAQLHFVCPVLEALVIANCYSEHLKVLNISAPKLYALYLHSFSMRNADFDFLGGCRIEIRTPNLTSLDFHGDAFVDCFTENLPHISDAKLQISKMEPATSFAIKLLKGLTSAKDLVLEGFEVFSQDTLEVLLTPFTSLRTLELKSSCKISSIHGMVHILNSCNSIQKFVWEVNLYVEVEGDEHLMLPHCRLSHLKHVHIKRLHGNENEIEFVKFLLKSSIVLDEIIINTARDSPKISIEENLKQFIEEEPSFRSIKLQIL